MALPFVFVGIDVSKDHLDLWVDGLKSARRFTNDAAGIKALVEFLTERGPRAGVRIAFEATGGYEGALRVALLEADFYVARLNPHRVRLYARSLGQLAKNDNVDARIIARYLAAAETRPEVLDPARERLAEIVSHRRRLLDDQTALGNQLKITRDKLLRAHHEERLKLLRKQIEATDQLLAEAVDGTETLQAKISLMKTVKGVKRVVAVTLAALLPELGHLNRRAIAALAGLAPFDRDSGKMKGKRTISGGRAPVRVVLYMAARAAALSKSPLGAYYARLIKEGKAVKTATVALMRKILVTLNAILRTGQPWKHAV